MKNYQHRAWSNNTWLWDIIRSSPVWITLHICQWLDLFTYQFAWKRWCLILWAHKQGFLGMSEEKHFNTATQAGLFSLCIALWNKRKLSQILLCVCVCVCVVHARTSAIRVVESLAQAIWDLVDLVVAVLSSQMSDDVNLYVRIARLFVTSMKSPFFIHLPGRDTRARISTRFFFIPSAVRR